MCATTGIQTQGLQKDPSDQAVAIAPSNRLHIQTLNVRESKRWAAAARVLQAPTLQSTVDRSALTDHAFSTTTQVTRPCVIPPKNWSRANRIKAFSRRHQEFQASTAPRHGTQKNPQPIRSVNPDRISTGERSNQTCINEDFVIDTQRDRRAKKLKISRQQSCNEDNQQS